MRKFLMIAACGALAACGSNEAETTTDPAEPMVTTGAQTDTASASQMAGTYEMTMEDGTVTRQQINADGTYVDSDVSGNELSRGTWRQQGDQLCLDEEGAAPEECMTGSAPDADGSFEMTGSDGSRYATVRRIGT